MALTEIPAWPDTNDDLALQYQVHLGLWTDWSHGKVMGATLTLDRQKAYLLIAFTASFVVLIGSRFWRIVCLFLHQLYSTSEPRDALHHQRQILLRNLGSSDSGVFKFVALLHAWPRLSFQSTMRIVPPLLSAILCTVGFMVAGGFSSKIQLGRENTGNAVLLDGANCSIISDETSTIGMLSYHKLAAGLIDTAHNYVQQCYSANTTGLADCNYFVSQRLPGFVDTQAPCPFKESLCRSNSTNIALDTGFINTDTHLGLNAAPEDRLLMRHMLQCAPILTKGYSSRHGNYTRYKYGAQWRETESNIPIADYTYEVESLGSQYAMSDDGKMIGHSYKLGSLFSGTTSGTPGDHPASEFVPIVDLARTDADLFLVFLSGNGVVFGEPLDDDWYRATKLDGTLHAMYQEAVPIYHPIEDASPLACASQWQFCNTNTSACGPTASFMDAISGAAEVFEVDWHESRENWSLAASRLDWIIQSPGIQGSGEYFMLLVLQDSALLSKQSLIAGYQGPIPRNQWQIDITNWFSIYLTYIQLYLVQSASGFRGAPSGIEVTKPTTKAALNLCSNQKIRTTRYSSFSFFGILLTYILGAFVVITSYTLEPVLACLHRRRQYKQYAYLEWTTNETLQLHRVANEGTGKCDATWSRCTSMVPTTAPGVSLSSLDISNLKHPRLPLPSANQNETLRSLSTTEEVKTTLEGQDSRSPSPALNSGTNARQSQNPNRSTAPEAETTQVCITHVSPMPLSPNQEQQVITEPMLPDGIQLSSPLEDSSVQGTDQNSPRTIPTEIIELRNDRLATPRSLPGVLAERDAGSVGRGGRGSAIDVSI